MTLDLLDRPTPSAKSGARTTLSDGLRFQALATSATADKTHVSSGGSTPTHHSAPAHLPSGRFAANAIRRVLTADQPFLCQGLAISIATSGYAGFPALPNQFWWLAVKTTMPESSSLETSIEAARTWR